METVKVNKPEDFVSLAGGINNYNAVAIPANLRVEVGGRLDLPFSLKTGGNTIIVGTTPDAEINLLKDATIIGTRSSRMLSLSNLRLGGDSTKGIFYLHRNFVHSLGLNNVVVLADSMGEIEVDHLTITGSSFINPHMNSLIFNTGISINLRGIRYDGIDTLIDATNAVVHGNITVSDVYFKERTAGLFLLDDLFKTAGQGGRPDLTKSRYKRYVLQDHSVTLNAIQGIPDPRDVFKVRDEHGVIKSTARATANRLILD